MTLTLAGELLTASVDDRVLTYRLLTFGEAGRTSAGLLTAADASAVTIPDDVTRLSVNVQHDRNRPAAKFLRVYASADGAGLDCEVRCLPTTTGQDMLIEAAEGVRPGISVELRDPTIRNGQLLRSTLDGAGFVTQPAFPSSLLVAADAGPDVAAAATAAADALHTLADTITEDDPSEDDPTDDGNTPADDPQEDPTVTASAPALGTVQAVPLVTASAADTDPTFRDVVRLLGAAENMPTAEVLAALSDIKVSGSGAVGVAALETGWLGELWSERAYERRYVPLATHGDLTSLTSVGWRWTTKPEVDAWAGNKAAVPSNTPATESVPYTASRLAGAHDVDRAYRDFNVTEFWDSYFRAMIESYARKSDAAALAAYIAAATPLTGEGTLANTTPWSMLVDGALAVIDAGGVPTSAVMGSDLYRAALLTPKDDVIALLELSLGLEEGRLADFKLLPASKTNASMTGKVLVQDRAAVKFKELPGSPVRVEGLDMVKGGVDPGVFGYYSTEVIDNEAIVLVSKPAT